MAIDPDVQVLLDELGGRVTSASAPLLVREDDTVIEGKVFTGAGRVLEIRGARNVTVRNCQFDNCDTAVYALDSFDIFIEDNLFVNAGRNFVQFDKVQGGRISRNVGSSRLGDSTAEDMISVYQSKGTEENPILVEDNYLANGGPSGSGSGIMVGDAGGAWITVRRNRLEKPGQVGIGVPGGTNIRIEDNTVISPQLDWSNVGIYVWNQSNKPCEDITVVDNEVDWVNAGGIPNPFWDGNNCEQVTVAGNSWQ